MGLAIGAGFYECVILAFLLMFLCIRLLPYLENYMVERASERISAIHLKFGRHAQREHPSRRGQYPSAVFTIRLAPNTHHAQVIAAISELDDVMTIDEI